MYKIYFIVLIFLAVDSAAQTQNPQINDDGFLFTYKDQSYIIAGDSLYCNPKGMGWIGRKHNVSINDLVFFQDTENGYLMHNSGGITYKFDGTNFSKIDDSFEFNSQYQSFPFLYKGAIYNFGGYGLFTFKNIITYFNNAKKETELVQIKTPLSLNPTGRKKMLAQINGDQLFIGSGFGYDTEIEFGNKQSHILNDYWAFDLKLKDWTKLGDGTIPYIKDDTYVLIYDFNGKTLVIDYENVFVVDIKNNTVVFYDNANNDLLKSNKKDGARRLITYNRTQKGFYLILDKPNYKNKIIFVSALDFMGEPTRTEKLYTNNDNSFLYYSLVGLLLVIIFIILILKKKNNYQKIDSKRKEIHLILNDEENQIFNLIFERYPNYTPFPELMDVFESHLSYESRKKKLRSSLYQIEEKITSVLKTKNPVFDERKNKEDLRIKEIKIN
jgi:hypothetical protein